MIFSCNNLQCTEPPKYFCDCKDLQTFLCSAHIGLHIDDNQSSKHSLQAMYKIIPPEKKAYIIDQCSMVLVGLKEIEINISASFNTVINALNEQKLN